MVYRQFNISTLYFFYSCAILLSQGEYNMENNHLDSIAKALVEHKTLMEKQACLLSYGRTFHIAPGSSTSKVLSDIYPERFSNIGSNFYFRKDTDTDKKYQNICIKAAEYLYEYYPLIFEFYDEYMNGITYNESQNYYKKK